MEVVLPAALLMWVLALLGAAAPGYGQDTTTVTIAAGAASYGYEIDEVGFTLTRTGSTAAAAALTVGVTVTQEQTYLDSRAVNQKATFAALSSTAEVTIARFWFQGGATTTGSLTATVDTGEGYSVGTPGSASTEMVVLDPAVTVRLGSASYTMK
ncbi:MAG: hypothetical protein OXF11_16220, partial [Deltaproteobacteria bacterium]|nr:hypothetical protein [Deltaproteobacteria bacterium]